MLHNVICQILFLILRYYVLDSRSRWHVLEQKDWKLSLEIKCNEYISVFPLIFQFPLNVLCSYKALINSTCNSGLYRIYKYSYFLFFQLTTYHWSFVSYQNICIFIKWKHVNHHAERSKYPIHPGVNFTSPTCNMPHTEKKQVLYMNYNLLDHNVNM